MIFMSDCYLLKIDRSQTSQSLDDHSFIGGTPKLPKGASLPCCKLCGAAESFFFQVAIPKGTFWGGLSLAVFACTSCADEDQLIPPMLQGPLRSVDIPDGFLESYQVNFSFIVFATAAAVPAEQYNSRVIFKPLRLEKTVNPDADEHKLGGNPNWLFDDESPLTYRETTPMFFLLQLLPGIQFEIINSAPRQVELGLDGVPRLTQLSFYKLFLGNKIFLFGTEDRERPRVYAITQVD